MTGITATPDHDDAVHLADGRRVGFARFGVPDARPVLLLHGNPGSRLICPDLEATRCAGVRLLTVDRPGIGGSDPRGLHRLGDVADDLATLLTMLDITEVAVIGWSAGGPYALALAARHPTMVTHVTLASSLAPPELVPLVRPERSPEMAAIVAGLRDGDETVLERLAPRFQPFVDDPAKLVTMTVENELDPDRHLMREPTVAAALTAMWAEGARQGPHGLTAGWAATWALDCGFSVEDVQAPLDIWHGTDDVILPVEHARAAAAAFPRSRLHAIEGGGHLIALDHWAAILAATAP